MAFFFLSERKEGREGERERGKGMNEWDGMGWSKMKD